MSNEYFTPTGVPGVKSLGQSRPQRTQWSLVEDGFDKLPLLAGHNLEFVTVNTTGTGLESIDNTTAIERLFGGELPDANFNDVTVVNLDGERIRSGYELGAILEMEIDVDDEIKLDWTSAAYYNWTNTREHTVVFSNYPTVSEGYGQTILLTIRDYSAFTIFFADPTYTRERPQADVDQFTGDKVKILASCCETDLIFQKSIYDIRPIV